MAMEKRNNIPPSKEEIEIFRKLRASPIFFIYSMWGLIPQPVKPEFKVKVQTILLMDGENWQESIKNIKSEWFEEFQKGKHITWQQWIVLLCIEKAIRKEAPFKLSIASGHGIGKTAVLSWIILWFLFVNYNSQVPCTAPTADQMYDVLWKELSIWITKMPPSVRAKYDWGRDHIRIKESPETWFARAKTSSKENSEALAGVHADHILTIADEASGVEERIFNTAEGAWTSGDIIVILISNPTRTEGYFYDTHHKLKANWQIMQFSSMDSPIVDEKYESNIAERHGRDSAEYGIRVLGKFPNEGEMDDSGYVSMFVDADIHEQPDFGEDLTKFRGTTILGVDPAGEGDDKTSYYLRDRGKAKKIHEEANSNPKGIAERILTFMEKYNIRGRNVVVDSFGVGADVAKEVAILSKGVVNIYSVNVGELSNRESDKELYINKRAEMYWKLRKWMRSGGEIIEHKNTKEELKSIKFKRNNRGKIQVMAKVDMKKKYGYKSPNDADALALTFLRSIISTNAEDKEKREYKQYNEDFDPFSVLD